MNLPQKIVVADIVLPFQFSKRNIAAVFTISSTLLIALSKLPETYSISMQYRLSPKAAPAVPIVNDPRAVSTDCFLPCYSERISYRRPSSGPGALFTASASALREMNGRRQF